MISRIVITTNYLVIINISCIALACLAFSVAQVSIAPCPCCQLFHWPVHPCPNHDNVRATNPSISQCIHAQTMTTSMLPTHALASASMPKPRIKQCFRAKSSFVFLFLHFCLADHHNGNAMKSNANMRKYRPYHALPTLLEASLKEHIVPSLALSLHPALPLHFPVKIKKLGLSETSIFFCVFLLRISS